MLTRIIDYVEHFVVHASSINNDYIIENFEY